MFVQNFTFDSIRFIMKPNEGKQNESRFFKRTCVEMHYYAGSAIDHRTAGTAFI